MSTLQSLAANHDQTITVSAKQAAALSLALQQLIRIQQNQKAELDKAASAAVEAHNRGRHEGLQHGSSKAAAALQLAEKVQAEAQHQVRCQHACYAGRCTCSHYHRAPTRGSWLAVFGKGQYKHSTSWLSWHMCYIGRYMHAAVCVSLRWRPVEIPRRCSCRTCRVGGLCRLLQQMW